MALWLVPTLLRISAFWWSGCFEPWRQGETGVKAIMRDGMRLSNTINLLLRIEWGWTWGRENAISFGRHEFWGMMHASPLFLWMYIEVRSRRGLDWSPDLFLKLARSLSSHS